MLREDRRSSIAEARNLAGATRRRAESAFWLLFATVAIGWIAGFTTAGFRSPDAHDYAQMGREIVRTGASGTQQTFPRHLAYLAAHGEADPPWPNLYRYPLPTFTNALFQRLGLEPVRAAVIGTGLWSLAALLALFVLARRLAGARVALLVSVLYAAQGSVWAQSRDGLTEALATFVVLLIAWVASARGTGLRRAFLLGALCAAAVLTRTQLLFLTPAMAAWTAVRARRGARLPATFLLLLGFALAVAPWCLRNHAHTGDPLFSFSTTRNLAWDADGRALDLELNITAPVTRAAVWSTHGPGIVRKTIDNLWPEVLSPFAWTGSRWYGAALLFVFGPRSPAGEAVPRRRARATGRSST